MGCDGIWEIKSCQDHIDFISRKLKENINPRQIVEELLDNCLAIDTTSY